MNKCLVKSELCIMGIVHFMDKFFHFGNLGLWISFRTDEVETPLQMPSWFKAGHLVNLNTTWSWGLGELQVQHKLYV